MPKVEQLCLLSCVRCRMSSAKTRNTTSIGALGHSEENLGLALNRPQMLGSFDESRVGMLNKCFERVGLQLG